MFSLIMVNTWRGLPFYAITLLAGLQTISPELYEAATIDGASRFDRFRYVTLPLLKPIIFIVTMFSVIFTFSDFQLIYVMTRGGPANATHVFATYAFDIAMGAVVIKGLHWEVAYPSGGSGQPTGSFSIGQLTLGGKPVPTGDPSAALNAVNQAMEPTGIAFDHIPVMPQDVLRALADSRREP